MPDNQTQGTSTGKVAPKPVIAMKDLLEKEGNWSKEHKEKILEEFEKMQNLIREVNRVNTTQIDNLDGTWDDEGAKGYKLDANTPIYRGRKD